MEKHLRFLGRIALSTFIGLVTLVALLILSLFLIPIIGSFIFPSEESLPEGFFAIPYFEEVVISFVVSYLFSVSIASFVTGYFLRRDKKTESSYIWWSLTTGFIIGTFGTVIFYGLLTNAPFAARDLLIVSVPSLFGALGGLAGYYVAGRKHKEQIME